MRCTEDDPILVRRSEKGDGSWHISYLPINARRMNIAPEDIIGYSDAGSASQISYWIAALNGDAAASNMVGMSLSFARGKKSDDGSWSFQAEPDWAAAELHFLLAAASGYWAAFHNLGAMYRHGFGVRLDDELAFHFALRAAELADDSDARPSIKALSELKALGWGTAEDRADAESVLESDLAQMIMQPDTD